MHLQQLGVYEIRTSLVAINARVGLVQCCAGRFLDFFVPRHFVHMRVVEKTTLSVCVE
jgi:hypothetical protein